jgi:hypothetical protein
MSNDDFYSKILRVDPDEVPKYLIIDPSNFQYSKQIMAGTNVFFSCWFTIDGEEVQDTDFCIDMAEPSTGRFCFYEVKGIILDFKKINGCIMHIRSDDKIVSEGRFKYYGIKSTPRRCISVNNFHLGRGYVQFRTKNEMDSENMNKTIEEMKSAKRVIDMLKRKA